MIKKDEIKKLKEKIEELEFVKDFQQGMVILLPTLPLKFKS